MHFDLTIGWGTFIGAAALISVVRYSAKALSLLKEFSEKLGIVHWQHQVLWSERVLSGKPLPQYPHLRHEDD